MSAIFENAPAKINLTLEVGPRAADGYHPLQSLVVFADIGDHLSFDHAPDLSLEIDGPYGTDLNAGPDNLVMRAAKALHAKAGCQKGAAIRLHKALPVASGIGGGSADAAATLRGLNRFWNCGLSKTDLEHIGQTLGADVPVCVQSQPRLMSGYGEILHDAGPWPVLHGVLVNPCFALSTARVFSRFDDLGLGQGHCKEINSGATEPEYALKYLEARQNNLTKAAVSLAPRLGDLLASLERASQSLLVRLCGSGATCLALTKSQNDARDLAQTLQASHPKYWVQAVKLGGGNHP